MKKIKLPTSYQMGHVFFLSSFMTLAAASPAGVAASFVFTVAIASFGILTFIAFLSAQW